MEGQPKRENESNKERISKLTLRELYFELLANKQSVGRLRRLCSMEIYDFYRTPDMEGFQTYGDLPINLLIKIPMENLGKLSEVGVLTIDTLKNKLADSGIAMLGTNKRS